MKNVLVGEEVYIKRVEREDLPKRVEWINDPEVQATLNYQNWPVSYEQTVRWFERVSVDMARRDFSVFTLHDDRYIGAAGLVGIEYPVMKAEYYVMIGNKELWGRGYGTDTKRVIQNYGFTDLGLRKIFGYHLVQNAAARKTSEKLGWKCEGLLRQDTFSHGKIKDRYIYSILYEDWKDINKQSQE